ncbi:MAG: AAA family ATPase [Minwuia sp.]|uniref:bifunctional aminoglycoside phosphotransferase/ATP-binding protein n=1 Tax=Minwuia sp. TaxID=2493630 RepID=UPI003A854511
MAEGEAAQREIVEFLSDPATHDGAEVCTIETHASRIFLAGNMAYKLKKAVTYPYLDYGDAGKRRHFCEEEIRINRRTAPALYNDLLAVTREADSRLALGGEGEAIDWLVPMRRFDNDCLLDRIAGRGEMDDLLCRDVADAIFAFHGAEPAVVQDEPVAAVRRTATGISEELRRHGADVFDMDLASRVTAAWDSLLKRHDGLIEARARGGNVRHLHGDLHLRNIVVIEGRPTLFDAIEFDPEIAEIDTLYDLAFLIMDLLHRDHRDNANRVLNRYLGLSEDYEGLPLLALFVSLRAGIRAHTTASQSGEENRREARAYLELADAVLAPARPRLICVGGASGSGKSTAAAAVAPDLGGPAGAIILRSDVVRKRIYGMHPEEPLPEKAYRSEVSEKVFNRLATMSSAVIDAGLPVIADAVFGSEKNAAPFRELARKSGIPLEGFWLTAPEEVLLRRVRSRTNDASDADETVLRRQLRGVNSPAGWASVDASGSPEDSARGLSVALEIAGQKD